MSGCRALALALLCASTHALQLNDRVTRSSTQLRIARERPRPSRATAVRMDTTAGMVLISMINSEPHRITMEQTMDAVEEMCDVTPVPFSVGDVNSQAGQNMGSAKVLSFGKMLNLDEEMTLHLFGSFYRDEGARRGPPSSMVGSLNSARAPITHIVQVPPPGSLSLLHAQFSRTQTGPTIRTSVRSWPAAGMPSLSPRGWHYERRR